MRGLLSSVVAELAGQTARSKHPDLSHVGVSVQATLDVVEILAPVEIAVERICGAARSLQLARKLDGLPFPAGDLHRHPEGDKARGSIRTVLAVSAQ